MAQPFLRWAGGKIWFARQSRQLFSALDFDRYHEPFLGGGAFFFSQRGVERAYLSDKNEALIEAYCCIKDDPERVIEIMCGYQNTEADYYRVRNQTPVGAFERAARFVYLNQTSFNGIYRVNLNGVYNVPYGHRTKQFLDPDGLRSASVALRTCELRSCDFMETLGNIRSGDLVFLDPPYTVSHNKNGFIKYNQALFSLEDQYRLSAYIDAIKNIGAYYILTNAAHEKIVEIFDKGDARQELQRASLIGGKKAKRGSVKELLFTNLKVK